MKKKINVKRKEATLDELLDELAKEDNDPLTPYPTVPLVRFQAYRAVDSERDYQDKKWGKSLSANRPGNGERSVDEFVLYIAGYTQDLVNTASHSSNKEEILNIVRKIAGLAVHCMEQHGAPLRK